MIYLCQPYSHKDPEVMESRFVFASGVCAALISQGQDVYAPIIHWHWIAKHFNIPTDATTWRQHNLHMIEKADAVYCLLLLKWQDSVGMRAEVEHAIFKGIPLFTVQILSFPMGPAPNQFQLPTLITNPVSDVFSFRRYFNGQDYTQSGFDA